MSGSILASAQCKESQEVGSAGCEVSTANGALCGETENVKILEQFQRVYAERLKRLDGDSELAMNTLKSWVHDLTEQNSMLVHTVDELERELLKRVDLMHDQLQKTSLVIKRNEHLAKRERSEVEINLREQVQLLQKDVSSLLDIVNQAKQQGYLAVGNVKLHTVSKEQLISAPRNRSGHQTSVCDVAEIDNAQNISKGDIDCLRTQLADKDAEIHNLLERIEEMQFIFTVTSKQVKQAVEAEKKSMQEMAVHGTMNDSLLSVGGGNDLLKNDTCGEPWVQERLKQQQEQVSTLISRMRELESDHHLLKLDRDRLAGELAACKKCSSEKTHPVSLTPEPSMIILSKELESTRQKFAEATKQVQLLASSVKDLEKKNYEIKTALTAEVAEKHEQMLELRREIHQLEEQVKSANMQTIFKDNIIREMRNELKVARSKISSDSGSDFDNKTKRKAFPAIPEARSVSDSGVDDGEVSTSHCVQIEVDLLRSQLNEQLKQISEKEKEVNIQKQRIQTLEKEIAVLQNSAPKGQVTQAPSITLRELEEYRLCTVEGQAAVEELQDEIEAIISDLKSQEIKVSGIEKSVISSKEIMQNAQQKLAQSPNDPIAIHQLLGEAKDCIVEVLEKSEEFVQDRRSAEQRRSARERKVTKLQEQLDAAHDNMRDGVEAMEQALAERYEADRLSQREFSDGSSYHSCRDSDSSSCLKQVERLEESNAELLSNITTMERQKRDAEAKAAHCLREIEKLKEQIAGRSFTDELLHTKEQTINELQAALESARRQMRDLQSDYERIAKERDGVKVMLDQQTNSAPLQVAELQSELARVRNQLASMNSKQALIEQYERRLKDSSDQAEKLSAQLNSLALNLQSKETMLSNKEEMICILQDTLDRTREEMKLLKDKSVSKSSFGLPWRNGKKKMGGSSSSTEKVEQDEASGSVGGVSDEQWQLVRELKLDLSVMLTQYQDCFSEVSRQTRWYRDLREAYQELRLHAENIKREALMSVSVSQREIESLRRQCQAQSLQICRLKEQVWEAEMGRQRAESEMEDLQGRISNYSQQISHFQSRLESLQTQLKETQTRMAISQEQVELQQLREFRDRWERAARSLADIDQQDKDCWSGLQWCESSESEDSQKREAKLEATLGLLMVEAGRRRRADASDAAPKDCDCASTDDSGSTKAHNPTSDPAGQPSQPDESQLAASTTAAQPGGLPALPRLLSSTDEAEADDKTDAAARAAASGDEGTSASGAEADAGTATSATTSGDEDGAEAGAKADRSTTTDVAASASEQSTTPNSVGGRGPLGLQALRVHELFVAPRLRAHLGLHAESQQSQSPSRAEAETQAECAEHRVAQLEAEVARLHDCLQAYVEADSIVREIELVVRDAQDALSTSLTDGGHPETAEAGTQTAQPPANAASAAVQACCPRREVRSLAEQAERQLRLSTERHLCRLQEELAAKREEAAALAALGGEVARLRGREAEARRLVVSVLCGFELEAQLRELDTTRLQRRYLDDLRRRRQLGAGVEGAAAAGAVARARYWQQHARKLEDYCVHVLWSPQGQLQGVLDENQQLRNQLGQLRAHNASLAAQLQEQCEESARCLADITSSLEADAEAEPGLPGRASGMSGMSPRGGRDRGSRRGPPATPATPATPPAAGLALATLVAQPVHTSLAAFPSTDRLAPTAPRRPAVGAPTAPTAAPGRASRARSSSGSSGGGGSTRRGGHRRRPPASLSPEGPEGPEADAGDYSDPADLCDSGFWSLQASPPRSASAMASVLAPSPAPARLCWLGQPPSPTPGGSQAQAPRLTASGATAFILNAHRPRPSRH